MVMIVSKDGHTLPLILQAALHCNFALPHKEIEFTFLNLPGFSDLLWITEYGRNDILGFP